MIRSEALLQVSPGMEKK